MAAAPLWRYDSQVVWFRAHSECALISAPLVHSISQVMRSGRAVGAQVCTGNSRLTSLVERQVVKACRRRLSRCAVGALLVLVGARHCRAHVRKLLSGHALRVLTVTSFLLGAKGVRRWLRVFLRAHARTPTSRKFFLGRAMCAPTFASFSQGAPCVRPCSQGVFRAHSACARGRKFPDRPRWALA